MNIRKIRNRGSLSNDERNTNKIFIISFSVLIIAILTFVISFTIYRNYLNNQDEIAELKVLEIGDLTNNETKSSETSSSIGKKVNEVQENEMQVDETQENENTEITNETTTNSEKIAINTSNMVKENVTNNEVIDDRKAETKTNETTTNISTKTQKKEEKTPDPTFKKPVEGEITNEFAKDTLIYSNTLQEWVTHCGIDIKADKTTIVKASAEGTVKSIKNDPRYGITVVIEHANGYSSVYSNLLTAEFIKEGEQVEQGQTIGTVGNTATFEIADDTHLHFEILMNGEYVNPELYLK